MKSGVRTRFTKRLRESSIVSYVLLVLLISVAFLATHSVINSTYGRADLGTANVQDLPADTSSGSDTFCRGLRHVELWGESVKWGETNLVATAEECCAQCKAMCTEGSTDCKCNSWVYCEDEGLCGKKHRQCWLKKQPDVLRPDVHGSSLDVGWTSGIIHSEGQGIISLETSEGSIRIQLHPDWAPYTVNYIREVLALRHCTGCQLYRSEGLGKGWDKDGNRIAANPPGPPYALLQGTLYTDGVLYKPIPREASPVVKRGDVCLIGDGPDFFISLAHHPEWGHGHTVFGEILPEDIDVVEKIMARPTKTSVWGQVEVQEFVEPLPFLPKRWVSA